MFAFNSSRSRTSWDGFSLRWFYSDPDLSVWNDPALQGALKHTLLLAVICVAIATPLGVALALGLQRWRGRGSGSVNVLMLLPLVTPEIVMGVALLLLFLQVFSAIGIGTTTQAIGQITFTISYVVVMVRGRLVSIGPEYEEAAADLGAPPFDVLYRVLLPLLAPAILASAAVVFALSIDDFVVTQYLVGRRRARRPCRCCCTPRPAARRPRRSMPSRRSPSSSRWGRSRSCTSSTGASPAATQAPKRSPTLEV